MIRKYKKGARVALSSNFVSLELDCKCSLPTCKYTLISDETIALLQQLRDKLGKPIKITSGYRCEEHNRIVGGASKSQHKIGTATDIQVTGIKPSEVAIELEELLESSGAVGRYNTFTHVDTRDNPARWDYTNK